MATGAGLLEAGDTLILADGTYTGYVDYLPSGSSGNYVTVRAANDGGAILTSTSAAGARVISLGASYVRLEGLKVLGNSALGTALEAIYISGSYNKILRCAFTTNSDNDAGANYAVVTISGTYNLLEDCWAWGGGRYKFVIYGGDSAAVNHGHHNILRRCVARHDRSISANGQATYVNYTGTNNIFQNCIAIDSDRTDDPSGNYASMRGAWFNEKSGDLSVSPGQTTLRASIALNYQWMALFDSSADAEQHQDYTITDFIVWDGDQGVQGNYYNYSQSINIGHATIGMLTGDGAAEAGQGSGFRGASQSQNTAAVVTNSIFYHILHGIYSGGYGVYNVGGANDYNSFYSNNGTNDYNRYNSTTGAHDITDVNPLTNSLLHLPRIASGGTLKGAGSGGSDIGATVMYRWGTSGAAYGETGYDTITAEALWPWPNEDRIKTDMSSYPSNWPVDGLPNPVRGFTAYSGMDGVHNTLTAYIWEYLGNQIPADIYGTSNGSAFITAQGGGAGVGTISAVGLGLAVATLTGMGAAAAQNNINALGLAASGSYQYVNIQMQ